MRAVLIFFALIQTLPIVLSVGCTKSSSQDASRSRGDVVVALSAPPASLDPLLATDATGSRIAGLLYSSLVRIGPDLKPVGEAARTWRQTGTTYVFDLVPHLTFSDGHLLSAADVDQSFARFQKSAFASSFRLLKTVHSVESGDHIVTTIETNQPSATFLADLISLKLLSEGHAGGTGPFFLESQSANDIVLRSRDAGYAKPKITGVDFKVIRDDNTRVLKMLKGEVDLAQAEFPAMKISQLSKSDRLTVYKYPGPDADVSSLKSKRPIPGEI